MNVANPIFDDLEGARAAIQRAMHALDVDADFSLRDIEAKVDLAAAAATSVPVGDRDAAHTLLLNLVADLNGLHARINREHRRASERLGRSTVNRKAFLAYGDRLRGGS